METKGYLIVLRPEINVKLYENRPMILQYQKEYQSFRKAFSSFNPKRYLGISRKPLDAFPPIALGESEMDPNMEAKAQMNRVLKNKLDIGDISEDIDKDLFDNREDAVGVHALLDNPGNWEIILVQRGNFEQTSETLGYDIGYWGGDHFSLIADTIVIPRYNGPPEKDYDELAERLSVLNPNLMFNNPSDAAGFVGYYKSKPWAEKETFPGEFCIIQVDQVASDAL